MFIPKWIMHPEKLFKKNQSKNKKRVKIIFTIDIKEEADRLIKNGLNFGYIKKSVLHFWEADLRTIYYRYCRIRYEKPKIYGNKPPIYKIYERDYHINNYTYNILIYKARKRKRCLYDLVKCGNCTSIG